jgi:hypothetical protein
MEALAYTAASISHPLQRGPQAIGDQLAGLLERGGHEHHVINSHQTVVAYVTQTRCLHEANAEFGHGVDRGVETPGHDACSGWFQPWVHDDTDRSGGATPTAFGIDKTLQAQGLPTGWFIGDEQLK